MDSANFILKNVFLPDHIKRFIVTTEEARVNFCSLHWDTLCVQVERVGT